MGFSIRELKSVLEVFINRGVDFIVIGDTVVQLAVGSPSLTGDIDLFVLKPSLIGNEEFFIQIARENNWDIGYTEIGTIKFIAKTTSGDVTVELYENMFDFNIPDEVLNDASSINIEGLRIKVLKPEHYVVLKAKQGVDMDKLKIVIKTLKNIDYRVVKKTIETLPSDERAIVKGRLKNIGLNI